MAHIFDLFAQAEPGARGGLGIGLALARGLIRLQGGDVTATSEGPGKGSEFVVRLPRWKEPTPPVPGKPEQPAAATPVYPTLPV
jgi:signal transduction histidine kinase